ncbi:hypothetical protein HMPREF1640_06985 [Prevotella sp. S7-1-8]|nr:hypothetical protein HMPREF1640_06985 [Prevotella sp. S7-1-8]
MDGDLYIVDLQGFTVQRSKNLWKHANLQTIILLITRWLNGIQGTTNYHDCSIYGDKGYVGADVQLDLFETAHIRLECPYRHNQKNWKPTFIPFAKARKKD